MRFHCVALVPAAVDEPLAYRAAIEDSMDTLAEADALGFDGVCLADPPRAPALGAAAQWALAGALAQRTHRAEITVVARTDTGAAPRAIAEEFAALDNLSGGRVRAGFRTASGANCHALGLNPSLAFERLPETCDLVLRCWTEPAPFHHEGACHRARYVNIFPRPFQRPHPPVSIISEEHGRAAEWAASRGFGYCASGGSYTDVRRQLRDYGRSATSQLSGWVVPVYVEDDDAAAATNAASRLARLFGGRDAEPPGLSFPPGFLASESAKLFLHTPQGPETALLIEQGHALVGSPSTIRRWLLQADAEFGLADLHAVLSFGNMSAGQARRSMSLFAREVMAPLRERFARAERIRRTPSLVDRA
jgi:alkanesulfonate monooxygenase SsuD/methylene tetrahydromethanopterin reductase-like flavin-dependent oxidoreductase (luciferase family)